MFKGIRQELARFSAIAARARALFDMQDVFVFGGLACVGYGVHQVYSPAAWIVVGIALFWLGIRSS